MAGDAAPIFVLIHSPLVGPGTWTPVARELELRGRQVVVPSLLGAATAPPPQWGYCVDAVRSATSMLSNAIVLVGHSGGGLLLPAITGAVTPEVSRLIFVDSGVPASTGETPLVPPSFLAHLRTLAVDGILPPWSSWFGDEAMRELVPDDATRTALERELPSLRSPSSRRASRAPPVRMACRAPTCSFRMPTEMPRAMPAGEDGGLQRSPELS